LARSSSRRFVVKGGAARLVRVRNSPMPCADEYVGVVGAELDIRRATAADADTAADFAVAKRTEYERYSPVLWRRAADDRAQHQPFLTHCIESTDFASFAAEHNAEVVGVIIANRKGGPRPFADAPEPAWVVDDFFFAGATCWS